MSRFNPNVAIVRCSSQGNGKISRFPVPDLESVPEDLRNIMEENLEKVSQLVHNSYS